MSLVICSNKVDPTNRGGSIYKPYSFQNGLGTPMKVPANSEVALQSIKLEKDGLFTLNNQSNRYFQYFGTKLNVQGDADKQPRFPGLTWIRMNNNDTESFGAFTSDSLAERITDSMNRGLYHPDIQGLANCSVDRTDEEFKGYNMTYDKAPSASGTNTMPNVDNAFIPAHRNSSNFTWVNGQKEFKINGSGGRAYGIGSKFPPLSLAQGRFDFTWTNASHGFSVGLSRYADANASFFYNGEVVDRSVGLFDYQNNNAAPTYCRPLDQTKFYDFVAKSVKNASDEYEIKLYHAVCDDIDDATIYMKEVVYYGAYSGANFSDPFNITNDKNGATGLRFQADGDKMIVSLMKGTAEVSVMCSPDLADAAKVNYFKPIAMTCSYLYPKIELVNSGNKVKLDKWEGRNISGFYYSGIDTTKSSTLHISKRLTNMDWWATLVFIGTASRYCRQVDTRVYNAMNEPTQEHTFAGTSASGLVNYDFVLITSQSDIYTPTMFANAQKTLGFDGRGVADTPDVQSGTSVTYTSNVVPKLVSTSSVFVRVNNLTQLSTNAGTGNQSKIIYHCPRFDTAGNEVGALFHEPGDRTYLKLNNPNEMTINSFDIDLVNEDETFAEGIIGKTIVSLHIRKSQD